jgi:hypothetical protein
MLYWPVAKPDSIQQKEQELALLDDQYVKLAARSVDAVAPGEQQPENDHGMISEKSETGIFRNMHWRSSAGFFSYRLRTNAAVKTLGITCYGRESSREFDIYLNDVKLTHVSLDGAGPDTYITKEYTIPESFNAAASTIIVKFQATLGSKTAAIYGVRLMR